MSTERDLTRIVRSWLNEDRHEDAEGVLNTVLDQLETTPQRRTFWFARRFPNMNNALRVGLAAAAVVIIAVIAINLLPGSPAPGGTVSPSPSAPAEPSSEPSSMPAGLPVGSSFVLSDGQPSGDDDPGSVAMTVTIPAPGWDGEPDGGILIKNDNADPPDGAGMIVWGGVDHLYVYGDPCDWSSTRPDTPSTTVDEVVAALAAQASRAASAPVDITLDGYAGKAITLYVPDDADFTQCDEGYFGSWSLGTTDLSPHRYHQGPGQIDEVWILDVDGLMVVIDWAYYAGTPQADVDELRAIVESTTFGQ